MPALADAQRRLRAAVIENDSRGVVTSLCGARFTERRLAIHQRHYHASLTRALLERFPATVWLVGSPLVADAAASFVGMWIVMMMAMMLPSLVPMLWRYREAVGRRGTTRLARLTALVGMGYFFVWTVFGMATFPLGVALAATEMQQPALARAGKT